MDSDTARTVEQLRSELAENRHSAARAMGDLVDSLKPENVARRTVDGAKTFVKGEYEAAKAQLRDETGWRADRIALIGGVALGVVVIAVLLSRSGKRS